MNGPQRLRPRHETDSSGEQVACRVLDSPVGRLVAGATTRGCCLLEYEDRGGIEAIAARVGRRYGLPMAPGAGPHLDRLEAELAAYFSGEQRRFTVPLDLRGTPFQQAVWRELLRIPYGEMRTYGQIAERLGRPAAFRAVGGANGENALAIVVPCHRVLRAGGKLGGYGGGLWRKRYLLDLESRVAGSAFSTAAERALPFCVRRRPDRRSR